MAKLTRSAAAAGKESLEFTFLTNHSHVLICLASAPGITLREVAARVGITERAVIAIVRDLEAAKVVTVSKQGRRNIYRINLRVPLRHPVESHRTVGDLLKSILS